MKSKPKKWSTLQHNGILFPPRYEAAGRSIIVRGSKVALSPFQEEMAYQWAKKKDTPYAQDAVFQKNFVADFASALGKEYSGLKYSEIDFGPMYKVVDREKDAREMMTKEERKELAAKRKAERERLKAKYGTAVLDGKEVELGNYMAEPPGIFIGRGAHPLRGKWKKRTTHEDVILNLGKGAKAPPGKWKKIVCNNTATWVASWTDELTHATKYVWFADTADIKQQNDRAKYDKAVNLSQSINSIKESIIRDMAGSDEKKARLATACYLIYRTAMRVGDEKDEDEADTVGATTLRKEHVKVGDSGIEFDFLGKDSVRWRETVPAKGHDVQFRDNMRKLLSGLRPKDEIFGKITSRDVNQYYSGIVDGLSAKVFRTYLASRVVAAYLRENADMSGKTPAEKIYYAKLANLEAAKMCNHKRTIPKTFEKSLEKKRMVLRAAKEKATKTDKQKIKKKERIQRLKLQLDLVEKTRDYNLGTSLRNYIDPRIFKSWTDHAEAPWEKLYTAALQKKFTWVKSDKSTWKGFSRKY